MRQRATEYSLDPTSGARGLPTGVAALRPLWITACEINRRNAIGMLPKKSSRVLSNFEWTDLRSVSATDGT